ncbi:MAG: small-conductance mechanosensitive channel [Chlamydiales bacterium]|jgi:MscS family membrane protein|nr:small-conductance mechanosensitive channel [Chlamydiales bacterium]
MFETAKEFFGSSHFIDKSISILFTLVLIWFFNELIKRGLTNLYKSLKKHEVSPFWGSRIILLSIHPLNFLIWVLGLSYILEAICPQSFLENLQKLTALIRSLSLIFSSAWILFQWKNCIQTELIVAYKDHTTKFERSKIDLIGKAVSAVISLMVIIGVMSKLGYPLEGILTIGGVGAAAIGFASKDVISNFFGGTMVYFTQPFGLGDVIRLPDKNIEGIVERIGWYLTCIRNPEKQPIYVPNAIFSNAVVVNLTRMSHRRIQEVIGVRYEDVNHISNIVKRTQEMLEKEPEIDQEMPILIGFNKFNESSLDIQVTAFTQVTKYSDYLILLQRILIKVLKIVEEEGAQIPYTTRTIEIIDNSIFHANETENKNDND